MSHRFSRSDKEKWPSNPSPRVRRAPVKIPASNTSALIEDNRLTLIGRVTNPAIQKTRALVDFFLQHWSVVGNFTGRDLGPNLFQFRFETEADLQSILRRSPYHFKRWMIILQRWEPNVSDSFPTLIPFWIAVHGLPLHFWSDESLHAIGSELGQVEAKEAAKGKVRVLVNGMRPLEFQLDVELPSGETKVVELQYENLDKHCFSCKSLCHETKDCPSSLALKDRLSKPVGINQTQTLNRIEADKKRQEERKLSRFQSTDNRGRGRGSDNRHYSNSRYEDSRCYSRDVDSRSLLMEKERLATHSRSYARDPASYSNQSVTHRPSNSQALSDLARPRVSNRSEGSRHHQRSEKETTKVWVEKAFAAPVVHHQGQGHISQPPSHTPSPKPVREHMISSPLTDKVDSSSSKARKSALQRLSLPSPGNNLLQHGVSISNSESNRLQDVEIQYLEDTLHTHVVDSASKPSGSRIPATERLSLPELPSSPIRTLSEDRLHVSLRLEGLPDQYPDEDAPPKAPSQQKKRRGRPPLVSNSQALPEPPNSAAPKKTVSRKRAPRSPLHGVSLKKRRVAKVHNSPRIKNTGASGSATAASPKEATDNTQDPPPTARFIPATSKRVVDFRTPPNVLP
ncbi:hypothetical protein Bca4012_065071 [Brassica carinata]